MQSPPASPRTRVHLFLKLDEFAPDDQLFWLNTFVEKLAPEKTCWLQMEAKPSEVAAALSQLRESLSELLAAEDLEALSAAFCAELEEEQAFYEELASTDTPPETEMLEIDTRDASPLFEALEDES